MSFEQRPSPARVTEAAAASLPRWLLIGLLAVYILPGLFGRDPWSNGDATAFGITWTMLEGGAADWWLPGVVGEPVPEDGPLSFWLGALFAGAFGPWLGAVTAARLVTVFWFALATWALWYTTYRLARRDEAQPVALAFGGEATPRDYGRMLADVAVLLLVATFGILVRLHETGTETALLALVCVLLFGLAYSLDDPWKGTIVAGVSLGAVALTRGWLPAGVLLVAAVAFALSYGERRVERAVLIALLAVLVFSLWPVGARLAVPQQAEVHFAEWWRWHRLSLGFAPGEAAFWLLRNVGWYAWPLWPFALWTIYSWRHTRRRPHIALPLIFTAAGLLAMFVAAAPGDREFLLAVPALVILAAFGASSLPRPAEDAIDWFSLVLFSLALTAVWLYFIAWHSGTPPKMAASVARLAPGYVPVIDPLALLVAAVASLGWLAVALWRLRARPPMLWTGPLLAASGLSLLITVLAALFAPAVDHARSYAALAPVLAEQIERVGNGSCVQAVTLPSGTRAMLAYHGGILFERPADMPHCRVALQRDSQRTALDDAPPAGDWELAYSVTRRARVDEVFRIWVRRGG